MGWNLTQALTQTQTQTQMDVVDQGVQYIAESSMLLFVLVCPCLSIRSHHHNNNQHIVAHHSLSAHSTRPRPTVVHISHLLNNVVVPPSLHSQTTAPLTQNEMLLPMAGAYWLSWTMHVNVVDSLTSLLSAHCRIQVAPTPHLSPTTTTTPACSASP